MRRKFPRRYFSREIFAVPAILPIFVGVEVFFPKA
jgi:hypothetical protein